MRNKVIGKRAEVGGLLNILILLMGNIPLVYHASAGYVC